MIQTFQGYRVISVDIPCVWSHHEWIQAFEKFLDAIDVHHVSAKSTTGISFSNIMLIVYLVNCYILIMATLWLLI